MTIRFTSTILAATLVVAMTSASGAAPVAVYGGQHARVMNSIARTQQRNTGAINHVQNSIAASQRRNF